MRSSSRKVGITTTIPIEVIFAAGCVPVDLNNLFISSGRPNFYIELAENSGFPKNCCSWIKGIYGVAIKENIEEVVGVVLGDCSNTKALLETLELRGIKVYHFAYHQNFLKEEIEKLMGYFGTNKDKVMKIKDKLDKLREKARYIDNLLAEAPNLPISAEEIHKILVSSSDFFGDIQIYEEKINSLLEKIEKLKRENNSFSLEQIIRLGYIGVPPIVSNLYRFIEEEFPAKIVYHELAYQFTIPFAGRLEEVYRKFTYPYSVYSRIKDIKQNIKRRRIEGLIHYVQSFCFRQIEDIVFKEKLDIPILTLECDKPSELDERSKLRIESFINLLRMRRDN